MNRYGRAATRLEKMRKTTNGTRRSRNRVLGVTSVMRRTEKLYGNLVMNDFVFDYRGYGGEGELKIMARFVGLVLELSPLYPPFLWIDQLA